MTLTEAGLVLTLDPSRNQTFPCNCCGKPGPHRLMVVGTYVCDLPVNIQNGVTWFDERFAPCALFSGVSHTALMTMSTAHTEGLSAVCV